MERERNPGWDDATGHVTSQTLPDGEVIRFGYDAVGNLTRVTPPSRPAHDMSYTAADQLAGYTPPATTSGTGAVVQYSYNLDRQLTGIALPSGKNVTLQYNSGGQLTTLVAPSGQYQYGYDATTGHLTSLIAGADGESLGFAYDGFLPTQAAWSGPVSGTIAITYDNNFRVTGLAVDGTTVAYGYDADSLLTQAGDLTVTRSAANGLITSTTLDNMGTNRSYDRFGKETTFAAAAGSSTLYAATYTYNKAGKITAKTEQTDGASQGAAYGYDANGRLVSVTQGATTTHYGYDANGNRVSVNGSTVATYNTRDQLLTYGQNSYTWTADGGLETKITPTGITHYTWNALGELTDVILPDGTTTHYVYDGLGHRVGKEKNGTLVAGYLYAGSRIVAETDASGTVTERFVYATKGNVPTYMIKYNADGTSGTYRIVSDQVGSVRLVINAATGAVVQRIDYDVWGKITADTDPGFQPFGFAGGLYDAATGLEHFGARDYDPGTARWINRDPILFAGGDANLYRYVVDDPVNGFDSLGEAGDWSQFVGTFTNGNPGIATPQGAAAMAAVGQAQQIAMAAQVAGAQCVWSQFQENFAYYRSGIPSIISGHNPLRSPGEAGNEIARATTFKSLEAMMRDRAAWESQNANSLGADIWNARAGNIENVGDVGESLVAVPIGFYLGAAMDAAGATLTSLDCSCGG